MYNRTTKNAPLLLISGVLFLSILLMLSTARADEWIYECVDCPKIFGGMSNHSLVLDDDGNPHIAYGLDHLYYAWFDGSVWQYETVDDACRVGSYASLAVDYLGRPHISYYDANNETLKYARKDTSGWDHQLVDGSGAFVGRWACIALDTVGRPHISYQAGSTGELRYACFDGTSWFTTVVDFAGSVGSWSSIGVDGGGGIHISYYDYGNHSLKYVFGDETGWDIQTVDNVGEVGQFTSLALDNDGTPHISYYDGSNGCLKYAYEHHASWQISVIDDTGDDGWYTSIAIDAAAYPHVGYHQYSSGDLKYAFEDGSGWHLQTVDAEGTASSFTSIALDEAGRVHIAYEDGSTYYIGDLKHASLETTGWQTETVDTSEYVGICSALALDAADNPHIVYAGRHYETIRYAHKGENGWSSELVLDSSERVGSATIGVGADNGFPHVSCQIGYPSGPLWYAGRNGGGWEVEILEPDIDFNWQTSVAVNEAGSPHIAYHTPDWFGLTIAHKDSSGWNEETIDLPGIGTHNFCFVLDEMGYGHVGYQDLSGNYDLMFAHEDELGWHIETADAYGEGGSGTSLALDTEGFPHLSHVADLDFPNSSLRYAFKDAVGWHAEAVEFVAGMFTSIDVDSYGKPHIAYSDIALGDLKYACKEDGFWRIETLAEEGWVGDYASLEIDSYGRVHISYHDHSNEDLRYVYQQGPVAIILSSELVEDELHLSWTEVLGADYWVYGSSNQTYFPPGFSPGYDYRIAVLPSGTLTWSTTNGIGDPGNNWAFLVLAIDDSEQELGRSNRVGEYDASLSIP